ncbi:MAG: flagellar hook-basal body complex protein, partial [Lachnospiraceae bacterium]|nr:flagellar hook-basal body complex protein [Lachnospiraceae bacterium]
SGDLEVEYSSINYELKFNANDGSFSSIGSKKASGQPSVELKMSTLGSMFSDINIDFTKVINVDNGGSATAGIDTGKVSDPAVGAGKKLGALTSLAVQDNGMVFGSYDNGNTVLLGQIPVAQFTNASGLESLGNNLYGTTLNSGSFDGIGVDVTADGGSMQTGQLEMSNVDLSKEFTEMITTQRGFQANSRIITVSDTMLEELTNLKR